VLSVYVTFFREHSNLKLQDKRIKRKDKRVKCTVNHSWWGIMLKV